MLPLPDSKDSTSYICIYISTTHTVFPWLSLVSMLFQALLFVLLVLSYVSHGVDAGKIQKPGLTLPADAAANADRVKSAFESAFDEYAK